MIGKVFPFLSYSDYIHAILFFIISVFISSTFRIDFSIVIPCALTSCIYLFIKYTYEKTNIDKQEETTPESIKNNINDLQLQQHLYSLFLILHNSNPVNFNMLLHLCEQMEVITNDSNTMSNKNKIQLLDIIIQDIRNCIGSFVHTTHRLSLHNWEKYTFAVKSIDDICMQYLNLLLTQETKLPKTMLSYPKPNPINSIDYMVNYNIHV